MLIRKKQKKKKQESNCNFKNMKAYLSKGSIQHTRINPKGRRPLRNTLVVKIQRRFWISSINRRVVQWEHMPTTTSMSGIIDAIAPSSPSAWARTRCRASAWLLNEQCPISQTIHLHPCWLSRQVQAVHFELQMHNLLCRDDLHQHELATTLNQLLSEANIHARVNASPSPLNCHLFDAKIRRELENAKPFGTVQRKNVVFESHYTFHVNIKRCEWAFFPFTVSNPPPQKVPVSTQEEIGAGRGQRTS